MIQPTAEKIPREIALSCADVRRVYDRRMKREVALKIVRSDRSTDSRAIRRVRNEAVLAGSLFHSSIPTTYN